MNPNLDLIYRGSVKNVYLEKSGNCFFEYSDRYSIFDWGEMPDQIAEKGKALATMGTLFFNYLATKNISSHFQSQIFENGQPTAWMQVSAVPVFRPKLVDGIYDYSAYQAKPSQGLVPLEIIFRWGAPKGSSLPNRNSFIKEGSRFPEPLIEFSTKLERTDRYLSYDEAQEIAGLSDMELSNLINSTKMVAVHLRELLAKADCDLWDGKVEWAFDGDSGNSSSRNFMLVDSIGLDELRVDYKGVNLSKEFLRNHYRSTEWYENLNKAKKTAFETKKDFKEICLNDLSSSPAPLPAWAIEKTQYLYLGFCNALSTQLLGKNYFAEKYSLQNWLKENA